MYNKLAWYGPKNKKKKCLVGVWRGFVAVLNMETTVLMYMLYKKTLFSFLRATVVVQNSNGFSTYYTGIMSQQLTYNGKLTGVNF